MALCLFAGSASGANVLSTDQFLFDFDHGFDFSKVEARDATVSASRLGDGFAVRITAGHRLQWPGITLPAPGGTWNLASHIHVTLKARNSGKEPVVLHCRVDNPGADGIKNCVTGGVTLAPGQTDSLIVNLLRTGDDLGGKLFGMRGFPVGPCPPFDSSKVTALVIFIEKPAADSEIDIGEIRARGVYSPPTASVTDAAPFFPFIDTFGQYKHRDWPGKTVSLADLASRRAEEGGELARNPGPSGWDKYGGWDGGPALKATGFFRTEKYRGKWWLVDPDGHLFFSQGIDCVAAQDTTPIDERQSWFDDFPGNKPEYSQFFRPAFALLGHYAGRSPNCFSFAAANLLRKYGSQWQRTYSELAHKRLRSWGINTIGNWSGEKTRLMDLTPYTDSIGGQGVKMIEGSHGYWGKFPDVFDPGFSVAMSRSMAARAGKSAGDPWCIGYFSDNEMSWGDETFLALAALQSPPDQPAKRQFITDLNAKYGDIATLNAAWHTTYPSWDALSVSRDAPDKKKAYVDLAAFTTKTAETYFRKVRDVIKAAAPNQLYLGCRFAGMNDLACAAAAKYCDVVSYNLYNRSIEEFKSHGDVPVIVGEFHFGALDRGLFHPGLVTVTNQQARAAAYKDYVFGVAANPLFVGAHWFEWQDEPTTGRSYDGENYQIGFVDVADTPYPEMISASREIAAKVYQSR